MSKLPQGWKSVSILEVLAPLPDGRLIHQGWSPQCAQGESPNDDVWGVLKTTAIQDGKFLPVHNKLLPDALEPRPLLEVNKGDILITCAGPRIRCGVSCLVRSTRPKLIISGKMYRMRAFNPGIDPRFVEAMLRTPSLQEAIDQIKTGMSESGLNLTHARFATLEIPVPPSKEQKQIADKLDAVLARVDACLDRLDRIPAIIIGFRKSVLAAATSGMLTREWREFNEVENIEDLILRISNERVTKWNEECQRTGRVRKYKYPVASDSINLPQVPQNWSWQAVDSLSYKVTDGVHKKPEYQSTGIPFITVRNLTATAGISFENVNYISEDDHREFYLRANPAKGDILISKDGTLGVVRQIKTNDVFSIFVSVALVKPVLKEMSDYLEIAFSSPVVQKQMVGVGTGLQHIHLNDLKKDMIPLPPIEEQQEIVRRVESLFAYADRLEARYNAARSQVEKLTPALLAKAFRGELVPQDPNDEPASELLARIAATKADAPPKKRAGKRLSNNS